jgi:polyphosphate kinase
LSWLEFNLRVLEEAENPENPLMERLKFLAIFSSNLDEFFMVRVSGLREQAFGESAPQDYSPDGMTAMEQLRAIAARTQELVGRQYRCLRDSLAPALQAEGFRLLRYGDLAGGQREQVDRFFRERALPILTPMAVDPAHPSPRYPHRGLYRGVMLHRTEGRGPSRAPGRSCCWKTWFRRGCRSCSADSRWNRGARFGSRGIATSNSSSRSRTTCSSSSRTG